MTTIFYRYHSSVTLNLDVGQTKIHVRSGGGLSELLTGSYSYVFIPNSYKILMINNFNLRATLSEGGGFCAACIPAHMGQSSCDSCLQVVQLNSAGHSQELNGVKLRMYHRMDLTSPCE